MSRSVQVGGSWRPVTVTVMVMVMVRALAPAMALVMSLFATGAASAWQASATSVSSHVDGAVTVTVQRSPTRSLTYVVDIDLPREDVWGALTTLEGIRSFCAPHGIVELRPGGRYEYHYKPEAPVGERGMEGTTILSFEPGRMLAGTGSAPPEFPQVRAEKTRWVIFFDDIDASSDTAGSESGTESGTRLTMVMPEWSSGDDWDRAFEYFIGANAAWFNQLHTQLPRGPIDWSAMGITPPAISTEPVVPESILTVSRSMTIDASPDVLWRIIATEPGLSEWGAVHAEVDLRFGGRFNVSFDANQTADDGKTIMAYAPGRLLAFTGGAEATFRDQGLNVPWIIWEIVPADTPSPSTTVRSTVLWHASGEQFEAIMTQAGRHIEVMMNNLRTLLDPDPDP